MAKCKFCEMFEGIRQIDNRYKKEGFSKKYKVTFTSETYRGEDFIGGTSYGKTDLIYCPKCGRKLDNEQIAS